MSEMVERVARRLHDGDGSACADWEQHDESVRDDYRQLARAAIEAMREPTEAMQLAGRHVVGCAAGWRAMIAAALAEETT